MAPRPARFNVVPADNSYPLEDFDVLQAVAKAPQRPHVPTNPHDEALRAKSAVHQVFNTTELLELILLDDNIRMDQLFVLQRVSKRLQNVIEGSQKLQIKMFGTLAYTSKDPKPSWQEDIDKLLGYGGSAIFNPLIAVYPTDTQMQLPMFRHFNFKLLPASPDGRLPMSLISLDPLTGAVEKKLKPHLGGSWENMKIARVSLTLEFEYRGALVHNLSLSGEDDLMGNLVEKLSAWYSGMRRQQVPYGRRSPLGSLVAYVRFD